MGKYADLLKRAREWSVVGRDLVHSPTCYLIHTPCLIKALADGVVELEADNARLQAAHDHQYGVAGTMLREAERYGRENERLREALRKIAGEDYCTGEWAEAVAATALNHGG